MGVGGSALPAVRAELNPAALFRYGVSLEDVRAALAAANVMTPKGAVEEGGARLPIYANDQSRKAAERGLGPLKPGQVKRIYVE